MRHIIFEESNSYSIAILIKGTSFNKQELINNYIAPLNAQGISSTDMIAFTLKYDPANKAPAKFIKEYLDNLLPALDALGVTTLYVCDGAYFKVLAGVSKADVNMGYALPCRVKSFEKMKVVLGVNYAALIYNPALQEKLDLSIKTLSSLVNGSYQAVGTGIIHSAQYPDGTQAIAEALESLHQYPRLSADIEAFSLRFNEAGIGTIAFAWDLHNGLSFACDYQSTLPHSGGAGEPMHGKNVPNTAVRALLRTFFETYQGELTWHNAPYDIKVIIYTLWMENLLDTEGLLKGLELMCRSFQDTKVIAYLATNSTAGNELSLKALAQEFAGNWAVEVKDIRKVPLPDLLRYNLVDALSTHYVKSKFWPIMAQDRQQALYEDLMKPSLKLIIQIELTGMPMSPTKVQEVKRTLEGIQTLNLDVIQNSNHIKAMNLLLQTSEMEKANAKLKVKQHPLEKFSAVAFNPNSGLQLQRLLYEQMGLPVIDLTDTRQPATGGDTLEKLINHTNEPAYKELIGALIAYSGVSKILNTFIPAFERAISKGDLMVWLHGSLNLNGAVSGRLSSSDPNLQNIPASSMYAKLIKECFIAPKGWLFCGADFNSLEDYISALTTKDRNKLKVYEQGYDGHCLRAYAYYKDEMPDIVDTVESINSIKKLYPEHRQNSKAGTFLLTYGGTYHGMMSNLGWPEDKSKAIEANYHALYAESDAYVQKRLQQASKDGFVEVAFGLRVRTPLLSQVVFGGPKMPFAAAAEARTAGNALGQSYGQLNTRAAMEFMRKVWASKYRLLIKPVALIHDSIYLIVKDDLEVVEWANRHLIEAMKWQDLPEIQHPTVKLGANLGIFWPTWANEVVLPNNATQAEIVAIAKEEKKKYE